MGKSKAFQGRRGVRFWSGVALGRTKVNMTWSHTHTRAAGTKRTTLSASRAKAAPTMVVEHHKVAELRDDSPLGHFTHSVLPDVT